MRAWPGAVAEGDLGPRIARDGFAFEPAAGMRARLGALPDWEAFAASWSDMPLDTYPPEGHPYRRRRHATLSAWPGEDRCRAEPHAPHYQSREYNPLAGGIERWFEPIRADVLAGPTF